MKRFYNFDIDIASVKNTRTPSLKQGDVNTNVIIIDFFDLEKQLSLDGISVSFIYLTPDEKIIYQTSEDGDNPITVDKNRVTSVVNRSVLSLPGKVRLEVSLSKLNKEILTTRVIELNVIPQIDVNRVIKTQSEFPVILRLIEDVEAILLSYEDVKSDIVNEQDRIANEIVRESNEVKREALKSSLEALKTQLTTDLNAFNTESQQKIVELISEKERVEAIYPVRLTALETTKVNNKNYSVKFEVVDNQPRLKMEEK